MKTTTKTILLLFLSTFLCTSCSKNDDNELDNSNTTSGTVTDADGNVYHTVTIGTQTWLVENLKTTKYNDGVTIPNVTDNTTWSNLTTGAYCNYNNDATMGTKYGHLYNWHAVNTGKLAPIGWHVPTDAEWTTLASYVSAHLGNSGSVAKALAATTGWNTSTRTDAIGNNMTKNNSTGFTALAGGERLDNEFDNIGNFSWWWCSDMNNSGGAPCDGLENSESFFINDGGDKQWGSSVRCVKN